MNFQVILHILGVTPASTQQRPRIYLILETQTHIKLLKDDNPPIILAYDDLSRQDMLEWIDISYDSYSHKKDVKSKLLNCMNNIKCKFFNMSTLTQDRQDSSSSNRWHVPGRNHPSEP